ncbi:MAG: hypothetical protein WKG00_36545 [Polyangiaceae bacterium]
MFGDIELGSEFFETLVAVDEAIRARVAAGGCEHCGGPLHRSDYDRKPRGGQMAAGAELFVRRFSLCCGREGCRRRAMPPSLRFLGRRVYVGAAVLFASMLTSALTSARACQRATGISARTTRRWARWWREGFVATAVFAQLAAQLIGLDRRRLPACLLEAVAAAPADAAVRTVLSWLAPLTTTSVVEGSRFVRGAV